MNFKTTLMIFSLLVGTSCQRQEDTNPPSPMDRDSYTNLLDIRETPRTPRSKTIKGNLCDLGSWMGYSLPDDQTPIFGFTGPFSYDCYEWVAQSILAVRNPLHPGSSLDPSYLPGTACISGTLEDGTLLTQSLVFKEASSAVVKLECDRPVTVDLQGCFMAENTPIIELSGNEVHLTTPHGEKYIVIPPVGTKVELQSGGNNYRLTLSLEEAPVYLGIYGPYEGVGDVSTSTLPITATEGAKVFADNEERWNGYLNAALREDMSQEYDQVAAKAVVTLVSNWKAARKDLMHDGCIPSHAIWYFVGFWAWDSWKSAVACADFAPEYAKDQIRAIFDYQQEDGMLIDCMYTDATENNARDSKPPLAAWAVYEVYKKTGDKDFLNEMYPKLVKYNQWWYQYRDQDKNGICEYGSTDGTLQAAAWESGMDNAIRFDHTQMVKTSPKSWSMDQESVDLNAFLVMERKILSQIAEELGQSFTPQGIETRETIDHFYDPADQFFYDRKIGTSDFVRAMGSEAYIPLWCGLATEEQFGAMLPTLMDPEKFSTYVPFPTAAADHPEFDPTGYWRGPIWMDQTYFAISGLRNYGRADLADRYTEQVLEHAQGLLQDQPIFENYDPLTGEGSQARHFSWSAAHLYFLYQEYGQAGRAITSVKEPI